jgi:hypothetical protein
LVLYVLTSFDTLSRGKEHYGFTPEQVVSVMSWALRGIIERLAHGDYPWATPERRRTRTTKGKTATRA